MEFEQICPACATINATDASICTNCSSTLSPPDQRAAAPLNAAKATTAPPVIRSAKGFRIFDGGGLTVPRTAPTALSIVEQPEQAAATAQVGTQTALLEATRPATPAPEAITPPPAPPGLPMPVATSVSDGQAMGNGWPKALRIPASHELTFAVDGAVIAPPDSAPAAPPAGAPTAPAPASPLAFHVDAATVPCPPPLAFQTAEPTAPAPTGESGGRGWGIREQRPNPTANWSTAPSSVREDPGSSALGVPRQISSPPQVAEAVSGDEVLEAELRSNGTARVLRIGMLVLLIVVVMFGALIHFGGH